MKIYSALKFLRYPGHLAALSQQRVVAPVHVRIKPINRCNHNCWYCAYRADSLNLGEGMDLADRLPEEKMREIVDDLLAMGVKAVTFSGGGEPLLYRSLPDHVEKLAQGGIRVATLTNGSNLKGRMAEAFAKHGTWIRVSMDGWDDESYARARDVAPGSYAQLLNNMRTFAASGSKCVLGVSFIIGHANHSHIYDVCETLRDIGVRHVKLSPAVVGNNATENNAYHQSIATEVAHQIDRAQTLETSSFQVVDHYHELSDLFHKDYRICPYLQFLTVIGADANVYTCQDKAYTESGLLGSIANRSFRDFWFSDGNRAKLFSFDPSVSCGHHCVTHPKNLAINDILSLDPDHGCFV